MNNIGDVGAQYIGDGLKSLTSLTTLILSGECCVVYVGVMFVCLFVCVCMCGCTVNKIGDIGAQSIGDGLKSLTSLTTLNLNCE